MKYYEDLLYRSVPIPLSKTMTTSLAKRIHSILEGMAELKPSDVSIKERLNISRTELSQMSTFYRSKELKFSVPNDSKQCLSILKRIKALKTAVNRERKLGTLPITESSVELARLEELRLKVRIENLKYRVSIEKRKGHLNSAYDLAKVGLTALSDVTGEYADAQREHFLSILENGSLSRTQIESNVDPKHVIEKEVA
ncbi:hypothetical protein [Vibrio sp. 10N.261.55.A7]|uniref:hypothetical protein n=1 Tax=Vibrio sp. 10N.261.55.A7 TaxID=1880851 RepID=UPI000C84C7EA|nr:hypothetical protein [Vibrio sp. 10N.261.55.A7]PMJ89837.1 hypothetical protein BCU12_01275 [Vibrio sp. 10N.261.55.A7]